MRFMSIDQSSNKFALAIFDDEELITHKYFHLQNLLEDTCIENKMLAMKKIMMKNIEDYGISFVVLEDIFLATNKFAPYSGYNSFKTLAKLLGVLELVLFENKILSFIVKASSWRATCKIKGKGGVQKDNAIKFVVDNFGLSDKIEPDTAEAICIGYHTIKKLLPKVKKGIGKQ